MIWLVSQGSSCLSPPKLKAILTLKLLLLFPCLSYFMAFNSGTVWVIVVLLVSHQHNLKGILIGIFGILLWTLKFKILPMKFHTDLILKLNLIHNLKFSLSLWNVWQLLEHLSDFHYCFFGLCFDGFFRTSWPMTAFRCNVYDGSMCYRLYLSWPLFFYICGFLHTSQTITQMSQAIFLALFCKKTCLSIIYICLVFVYS